MISKFLGFTFLFCTAIVLSSCTEEYETIEGVSGIFIKTSASSLVMGEEVTFEINTEGSESLDVTGEAEIRVNGEILVGNSFSTAEVGVYEVTASYLNLESSILNIEFYDDGSQVIFKKRALIEDYTGTWCGWCPRVSFGIELVANQSDAVEFVAIHRAPAGTQDPFNYLEAGPLELLINTPGYPKGFINRLTQWDFPEPDNTGQVLDFTQGVNPRLGIKMSSGLQNNTIDLKVEVQFAKDFENTRLVVYLLENALVYPQVNYTSFYGSVNPISNYVHNYTLRTTLTDILGDQIASSETQTGNSFERDFNFQVPDVIEDATQIDFVAFIVDEEGSVINVRKASLGVNQEFEIE
jgi:hypothetical protein